MTDQTTEASKPDPAAEPLALRSNDLLGPALEDAADDCLSALAGVETYDVNLRDHPDAWKAIEAFTAKVRAAERERCSLVVRTVAESYRGTKWGKAAECFGDRCMDGILA